MAGQNNFPFIINVGNSIIGVTVLAMPFCFKACGIILGSLLLLFSTWLTLVSCQLLLKAGITARRRSYSFLAYYTHGAIGKLIVELGMIGLQLGTLVAQVVIIGDLGPAIVSKALGLPNTDNLRTGLIIFMCLFVGLPLGLLKDVRMLSNTSTMCIMFYSFFTVYVILQALPNLLKGQWYSKVNFWRIEGFFQCLPIFSFAFGCQTQLFIVYDALAEPSLKRMNSIVGSAVNMCSVAYLLVGFFGNVAFCDMEISGDIIKHFKENSVSDGIKLCFVVSIAVSIPLIVFPCRVSLYNLLFPQKPKEDIPGSGKIPEFHFRAITVFIIVGSMIIGIMVPNVEFVLGLNGATMGSMICYIFPALFFLNVMYSSSDGKWTARLVLMFGLTILIASTYTTLMTQEKKIEAVKSENIQIPSDKLVNVEKIATEKVEKIIEQIKPPEDKEKEDDGAGPPLNADGERQEPPNPQPPEDKEEAEDVKPKEIQEKIDMQQDKEKMMEEAKKDIDNRLKKDNIEIERDKGGAGEKDGDKDKSAKLDEDRVKREEIEKGDKLKQEEKEKKQDEILGKLAEQQEEQQKLIKEQKQILEELKQHKEEHMEKDKKDQQNVQNVENQQNILQPVHQVPGQQVQNQQLGIQQAGQGHLDGQQVIVNQQVAGQQNQPMGNQQIGNQQMLQNEPVGQQQVGNPQVEGQQALQNQPVVQQQMGNQQIGNQQMLQNEPVGQQQVGNPLVGGQQALQNQPVVQQQMGNQQIGNQQMLQNEPVGQQQVGNPAVGGQQALQNQPVVQQQMPLNQPMEQQHLGNQPLGDEPVQVNQHQPVGQQQLGNKFQNLPVGQQQIQGQPAIQQQPIGGQDILQNQGQQGMLNQGVVGQQQFQNQPVNGQQAPGQQQFGIPNDLNVQNKQQVQQVPQQAQDDQPAADHLGQNLGGYAQAGNIGNAGLQNIQVGQQPAIVEQQAGNQADVRQVPQGNIHQNMEVIKDQNIPGAIENAANQVQNDDVQGNKDVVKDDALKRRKRDTGIEGLDNNHEQIEDEKAIRETDKVIKDANVQRDLKQMPATGKSFENNEVAIHDQKDGDQIEEMIQNIKDNLYLDSNRKNPFVVEMIDKNLGSKRR